MPIADSTNHWDRLGIAASALCMVHCIALPVAFALLPALAAYDGVGDYTHVLFGVATAKEVFASRNQPKENAAS